MDSKYHRDYYHSKVNKEKKKRLALLRRKSTHSKVCKIKVDKGCINCGFNENPAALQFDHINPSEKIESVSEMIRKGFGFHKIEEEINKCQVMCANCHAIKTSIQHNWY